MKDFGFALIGTAVIVALVFAGTARCAADVRVSAVPAPIATNILGIKEIGGWTVSVINYSDHPVPVSPEMILASLPKLHRLDPKITGYIMAQANYHSRTSRILRLLDYGTIPVVAFMGGGIIKTTAREVAEVAIGLKVADKYGNDLKAQQPDLAAYGDNLPDGEILLPAYGQAGFSRTYRIYSGKIKGADTMQAQIYVPDVLVAAPTASPKPQAAVSPANGVVNYGWDIGTAAEPAPPLAVSTHTVEEPGLADYEAGVVG